MSFMNLSHYEKRVLSIILAASVIIGSISVEVSASEADNLDEIQEEVIMEEDTSNDETENAEIEEVVEKNESAESEEIIEEETDDIESNTNEEKTIENVETDENLQEEASQDLNSEESTEITEQEETSAKVDEDVEYLDNDSIIAALREEVKSFPDTVILGYHCEAGLDLETVKEQILEKAMDHTGKADEGDFLRWQCVEYGISDEKLSEQDISNVILTFSFTWSENRVSPQKLLESLNLTDKTDYEKICEIYNTLNKYEYTDVQYASMFYYLALSAGIDCRIISGTLGESTRVWNIVKLDGYYYNVDLFADMGSDAKLHFLKANKSFAEYNRDEEYLTEQFESAYPMVEEDYEQEIQNPEIHNPQLIQDSSLKSGQEVIYDMVKIGCYPQREITSEEDIYNELENEAIWDEEGNTELNGQRYHQENGHFYLVEPIIWRVLQVNQDGTAVLQADKILDVRRYHEDILNNEWHDSSLRRWLNQEFFKKAFTDQEKEEFTQKNRELVLVGDSYLDGYSADGMVESWGKQLTSMTDSEIVGMYHMGGYGFSWKGGFAQLLPDTEDEDVTDVLVLGGWNDHYAVDQISDGVKTFVQRCKAIYPNAKVSIGMVGYDKNTSRFDRWKVLQAYISAAAQNGCDYIWGVEDALTDEEMSSDGYHPKVEGQTSIAKAVDAWLEDSVSLLTESQMYDTLFSNESGFSELSEVMDEARRRNASDYASQKGLSESDWWLRTSGKGYTKFVYDMGDICRIGEEPLHSDMGICPVLYVNLNQTKIWSYAGTFSTTEMHDARDDQDFYRRNGIHEDDFGIKKYYKDGKVAYSITGLITDGSKTYYVKNGVVDISANGLVYINGTWYYMTAGEWNLSYNGFVKHVDKKWYHVKNGVIEFNYTGLVQHTDGQWYYANKGVLDWSYTNLVQYYGTWYYVRNGKIDWNYTNLVQYYGTWYYVRNGKIDWNYTNLVQYYGTWYYVQKGKLNWNYTGLVQYYGTWYYVQSGKLNWNYSGLTYYYGTWYYVQKGKIVWNCTTLVQHSDQNWYYIENSKINWNYSGLAYYYGTWYYIQRGKLNWKYNGTTNMNGMTYTIRNGRAVQIKNNERGR